MSAPKTGAAHVGVHNRIGLGFPARPNEMRLSCAALVCFSQMQFYYDGRRQLQPLVRQLAYDVGGAIGTIGT